MPDDAESAPGSHRTPEPELVQETSASPEPLGVVDSSPEPKTGNS